MPQWKKKEVEREYEVFFNRYAVMGWIVSLQNSYIEVLTHSTSDVTVFGDRDSEEVVKVKWSHIGGP